MIIALARGGIYSEARRRPRSSISKPILRGVFNFIGIEPEFVDADGLDLSPEQRSSAIEQALGETVRLAA